MPRDLETDGQKVRVQRRLVENLGPDPLAGGDLLGPQIVLLAVPDQDREQGRGTQLSEIESAQHERCEGDEHQQHNGPAQIFEVELGDREGHRRL